MQGAMCYLENARATLRLLQLTRAPVITPMTNSNIVMFACQGRTGAAFRQLTNRDVVLVDTIMVQLELLLI